jgi:hypothetical protein
MPMQHFLTLSLRPLVAAAVVVVAAIQQPQAEAVEAAAPMVVAVAVAARRSTVSIPAQAATVAMVMSELRSGTNDAISRDPQR